MTEVWAIGLVLLSTVFGALGPIYLKKSKKLISFTMFKGIIFYGLGTLLFVIGLRGGELSVLYPLVSIGYVLVCLFSIKMLGEQMSKRKWLGILSIVIGVIFIGVGI